PSNMAACVRGSSCSGAANRARRAPLDCGGPGATENRFRCALAFMTWTRRRFATRNCASCSASPRRPQRNAHNGNYRSKPIVLLEPTGLKCRMGVRQPWPVARCLQRQRELGALFGGVPNGVLGDALEIGGGDGFVASLVAK